MKAPPPMRSLKLAAAVALAAWLGGSFAQQGTPPAPPPANRPPPATPAPPAPPPEQDENEAPRAPQAEEPDDVFVPTEELQPDAAVTFPVDI
jgi:hypothetical protein